jgi:NADP-dependent 3-hydroxy acid dehydrogenase YdfG
MSGAGAVSLAGRTALVSGASRGIGFAVARAFVNGGARVVMLARGADALHAAAGELGSSAIPMTCDAGDRHAVERVAAATLEHFGAAPDVLVNNAGLFSLAAITDTTPDAFASALDVNLIAPFVLIRAFLPAMRARAAGHVISIGSIADRHTFPENGAYAASKYGLRALHEVLRAEVGGSGVRATLVSPGPVDTTIWDAIDPDHRPGFTPRSRMLDADAVASAVVYAATCPANVNVDELRLSRA